MSVHNARMCIDDQDKMSIREDSNYLNVDRAEYKAVAYELGHESHFREFMNFNYDPPVSIRYLIFDVNYFNCYFKPILDELIISN